MQRRALLRFVAALPGYRLVHRRSFLAAVATMTAKPLLAEAQQTGRLYTVGILSSGSASGIADVDRPFRDTLAELGYVEGRNLVIQYRFTEGDSGALERLALGLVRMNVDVLVTNGTPASLAAKRSTSSVPIVAVSTADPVGSGLVQSLGKPGGNVTGVSAAYLDIASKWIEILREITPRISRLAFLGNAENPVNKVVFARAEAAGRNLGILVEYVSATKPEEVRAALIKIHNLGVHGVIVPGDAVIRSRRSEIAEFVAGARLPTVYFGRDYVEAGGLLSYGPDRATIGRNAAAYVDKILKGARAADLPVEQPTKYELVINLKAAKALGLAIPQSLLLRAEQVIE